MMTTPDASRHHPDVRHATEALLAGETLSIGPLKLTLVHEDLLRVEHGGNSVEVTWDQFEDAVSRIPEARCPDDAS